MRDDIRSNYYYLQATFILVIIICTRDSLIQHLIILCIYVTFTFIHGVVAFALFQLPLLPLLFPFLLPFVPLFHLLGALQL